LEQQGNWFVLSNSVLNDTGVGSIAECRCKAGRFPFNSPPLSVEFLIRKSRLTPRVSGGPILIVAGGQFGTVNLSPGGGSSSTCELRCYSPKTEYPVSPYWPRERRDRTKFSVVRSGQGAACGMDDFAPSCMTATGRKRLREPTQSQQCRWSVKAERSVGAKFVRSRWAD